MSLYPLKLSCVPVELIWGGRRLINEWGKKCEFSKLAETYELTLRDDGKISRIENGEYAGLSLKEYIEKRGNTVVSDSFNGGRFPLLIKFIDAADRLSVQVHPDDVYAGAVENDSGKTEIWYIVDAEPGAKIVYGLKNGATREDFAAAVADLDIDRVLNYIEVKPGESYFVPSGMVHAIGKGILIAEIQQNSDLTYRVYDYGRIGADGKPRQLHVGKALDVVRPFGKDEIDAIRYARSNGAKTPETLADSEYFKVLHITKPEILCADRKSFHSLLVLADGAKLVCGGETYTLSRGDSWYLPAGLGEYKIHGENIDVLVSSI